MKDTGFTDRLDYILSNQMRR